MSIKTISATTLRNNLADALDSTDKDAVLIVTRRGKTDRAIVDLDRLQDLLAASDPKYLSSIKKARDEIKKGEVYSFEEVFGNI